MQTHPMNRPELPRRRRLTVRDYERMGEAGIFPPEARVELLDGDLVEMPPMGQPHAGILLQLTRLLVLRAEGHARVATQLPLSLPPWSMPEPDFVLLRLRADDYRRERASAQDVLVAIEVADSSLRYDLIRKARVYAANGLPEYWVIEASARRLHRFVDPRPADGHWGRTEILEAPFTVSPNALPQLALASDEIWPPAD